MRLRGRGLGDTDVDMGGWVMDVDTDVDTDVDMDVDDGCGSGCGYMGGVEARLIDEPLKAVSTNKRWHFHDCIAARDLSSRKQLVGPGHSVCA